MEFKTGMNVSGGCNLGKNAEVYTTQSGKNKVKFVGAFGGGRDGGGVAVWKNCGFWCSGTTAAMLTKVLVKGFSVGIVGFMVCNKSKEPNESGKYGYFDEVVITELYLRKSDGTFVKVNDIPDEKGGDSDLIAKLAGSSLNQTSKAK